MLLPWLMESQLVCWKIEEAQMFTQDGIDTQFTSKWMGQILWMRIKKFSETSCKLKLDFDFVSNLLRQD